MRSVSLVRSAGRAATQGRSRGSSHRLRHPSQLPRVIAHCRDALHRLLVVAVRDLWRARHEPHIVALAARHDGLAVVISQPGDDVLSLDRPDELHAPDGVARVGPHRRHGMHRVLLRVEAAFAVAEVGLDPAVRP
ncbi:hypothetical protein G6F24_014189 [Rhizopus arrhizus]|nr:hypothetical protein G6F24_014189 [Rhizopus arrhizus]